MSKKSKEIRAKTINSRRELRKIKALRMQARNGVAGAASELEAVRQARILRNMVSSPLEQVRMEPRFL
jgi:hypothetical protein